MKTSNFNLHDALKHASIPTLTMCLAQITGDECWLEAPFVPQKDVRLFADESGGLDEATQQAVRDAIEKVMGELERGDRSLPGAPDQEQLARMMRTCVAEPVPAEYVPLMMEEFGFAQRDAAWHEPVPRARLEDFQVLIVGAGMSGICAAVKLEQLGIRWTLVEKNADVGGVWMNNDYPEAGVDTPNHFYSYSFAPNTGWTGYFSKRDEVWKYFRDVADRFNVREKMRFSTEVNAMAWNDEAQRWEVDITAQDGVTRREQAHAVICAVGQLNRPKIPSIPGLADFAERAFHTAEWRHDVPLDGKRVALVGTGASSMQVLRTVAEKAAHVTIFQRSPQWVRPSTDYHRKVTPEVNWLLEHVPYYYQWYRFGLFWRFADGLLKSLDRDPDWPHPGRSVNKRNDRHRQQLTEYLLAELEGREDLVPKVLPDYPPYGKRILVDNDWYRTLKRDNVSLVNAGVSSVSNGELVDSEGTRHPVDVIVLGTGFEAGQMLMPMEITGRAGVRLHDLWEGDNPRAYKGITVPGFPNLFCLYGPNTNLGHGGSVIFQAECQVKYVTACLVAMLEKNLASIDVRSEVHDSYNQQVDEEHGRLIWTHPGMTSWHRNAQGRVFSTMPWRLVDYWNMTREPDLADYRVESRLPHDVRVS
ncbi:MAG: NAD(P)/FAD-dependent oxidoreductase [Comamonadaceae bacterium]|nr:MAG: NAD(P)/FAD-dependent oxidoreductase [Comamonadaceae bacterium]